MCFILSTGFTGNQILWRGPRLAHRLQVRDSEPGGVFALLQNLVSSPLVTSGQKQTQMTGYAM